MNQPKKLIEVALPLDAINAASAREKSIRHGHPSTLHLWWARRPLAAARAVIFAQLVDDPSSHPDLFPTAEAQEQERQRLFRLIEQLVLWENTTNETVLQSARDEIWKSWRRTCAAANGPPGMAALPGARPGTPPSLAAALFDPEKLPAFHDPFAGGGSLPLEAQRLGLESYASDLNPVAVLINKAMIEIPPKFAGRPPVNPADTPGNADIPVGKRAGKDVGAPRLFPQSWRGAQGLAADVRYYGQWMRDAAEKRIGHLYPKVAAIQEPDGSWRHATPAEIQKRSTEAHERPKAQIKNLTVIAWLWARTVKSPNPAFAHVDVPLASTFMLSTKTGKEAWVEPVIAGDRYHFVVKTTGSAGIPAGKDAGAPRAAAEGTKLGRGSNFQCILSAAPISGDYIKAEGQAGRMGARMMAIVAEGERGRIYLAPTAEMEAVAQTAVPRWRPSGDVPARLTGGTCVPYGLKEWGDLFTPRQLVALTTFSDLVQEARGQVLRDAQAWERRHPDGSRLEAGAPGADDRGLAAGGVGATAYADAVAVYLAFGVDRLSDRSSTICSWDSGFTKIRNTFSRQAIPMTWDYAEGNPFSDSTGNFIALLEWVEKFLIETPVRVAGQAMQQDASTQSISANKLVSTDPPYCLAPGTLIQTPEGYKPIECIQVDDQVLTHAGRFARVTRTYQRPYTGMLYHLKVAHTSQPIMITGEHPVYGMRTGSCTVGYADYCHIHCAWMAQNSDHCSARLADRYHLEWIPASEIRANDLVFLPTLREDNVHVAFDLVDWLPEAGYIESEGSLHYQKATARSLARREAEAASPRRYVVPTKVALTPELCRLLGYFVADGYARIESDGGAIHFTFHVNEQNLVADVERLMAFCFGLHPGQMTDNRLRNNQSVRLNFYSKPLAQLLRQWCYTENGLKRLPQWAIGLDVAHAHEIIRGYWAGDGYRANGSYIATTNSPHLAGQLRLLLQRLQISSRLHIRHVKPSIVNGKAIIARGPQYGLYVSGPSLIRLAEIVGRPKDKELSIRRHGQHGAWWEGGYLLPVRAVQYTSYEGFVYNLETEDHSYVTAAGCVHNCDNIGYADLSDFFYVWLRRALRPTFPTLFATLAVPKAEELVSASYRHGSKMEAEAFFLNGMTQAMHRLAEQAHPAFPVTIYYAYKQAETKNTKLPGMVFTGWETFLDAVIQAGFAITGTWPVRTELSNRMVGMDTNALATSIVLVCCPRPATAPTATRREFLSALRAELPTALTHLQRGNIAPVDLAQAAIGPGMAVYTRYARVLDAAGRALSVREALALINQTLDEVLAEQEGDFDADSRWALAWFEQFGFNDGPFGDAETLSKAKNTAMQGLVEAGLVLSRAGRVRLLRPAELPADWNPVVDSRLTVWEMVHHLIRALDTGGEGGAALLAAGLGSRAETARELAYRLYTLCERRKRAQEALAYNSLVQSWPEILRLAEEAKQATPVAVEQPSLFG